MTGTPRAVAYRPEIDGLRAIAVVIVMLFHADFAGWSGGFIGVDLFFVISGYLITGILASELAEGRFSIARFYERRIRRIIPALMLVMLLSIPFAIWLMLPDDLENFGQSLVGTTLFANNILLLVTSGYFGVEAQFKPLMHTWSLGVEEQYYLAVPLLMWAAWRWGKAHGLLIGIAAATLLSFLACLVLAHYAPRFDFFLIVSRGWELGAGGLAMLVEPRIRPLAGKAASAVLAVAGLALIALGVFVYHSGSGPSLVTVIPIAGICLILLFGGSRDPVGRLLASPPLVGIGLISYSAYLFHLPIFAFVRLASLEEPSPALMAALLVPAFLCAWASWRFVEQPCRDRNRVSTRVVLTGSAAAALLVVAVGLTFHLTSGFYRNWPELAAPGAGFERGANIAYNVAPERFRDRVLPATNERVRVLVIGNSFGRDFINMGLETGSLDPQALSIAEVGDCQRLPPALIANAARADFIVLASRFRDFQVHCIQKRVAALRGITSAPVTIIGRKSFGWNNNAVMLLPQSVRLTWRVRPSAEAVAANRAAKRTLPAASYADLLGMIGDGEGKVPVFTPEGKFISQDREHLTIAGARYLGPIVFRHPALAVLAAAVRSRAAPAKP
ncbi:MAG: acyltransferase family protein [Pseudomonadota bacterium]